MQKELAVEVLYRLNDPHAENLLTLYELLRKDKELGKQLVERLDLIGGQDENVNPNLIKFRVALKALIDS